LRHYAISAKATPRAPRKPRTMGRLRGMQRPINGPLQGTGWLGVRLGFHSGKACLLRLSLPGCS
jgi:hypothetical protein